MTGTGGARGKLSVTEREAEGEQRERGGAAVETVGGRKERTDINRVVTNVLGWGVRV